MNEYHRAYLSKGTMTEEFFLEALANGFDIHHVDGDHNNNDPDNLVMIYKADHFTMHGAKVFHAKMDGRWMTQEEIDSIKATQGEKAYKLRASGLLWREVDETLGKKTIHLAKFYAQYNKLEWPIKLSDEVYIEKRAKQKAKTQQKIDDVVAGWIDRGL